MGWLYVAASSLLAGLSAWLACSTQGRGAPRMRSRERSRDSPVSVVPTVVTAWIERLGEAFGGSPDVQLRAECLRELPEMLDIVTLGLGAGLSFDASLELYCARYDTQLARCFEASLRSWQLGVTTRAQALDELARRLDSAPVARFSSAVSEALAFGIPLASTLEHQADAIREEQRMQTEEAIEKVPVKMLVPLGTLIVPAMLLAILGPLLSSALVVG